MIPRRPSRAIPILLLLALASSRPLPKVSAQTKPAAQVTWNQQIAPILYKNCTSCHHPNGSGPFPLTTYQDAKRRADLLVTATQSRYMPPWLPAPAPSTVPLAGSRRLSDEDIALIRAWVHAGMPEGNGSAPLPPTYSADWQLGPPDLILEMSFAIDVPASGTDLFENAIFPVPITATRWVRAMEITPGTAQVTHHANVILDRTASLRRAHPTDWQRGIPGMDLLIDSGDRFDPDSHFLFWKPDSTALVEPDGMPWRLDRGNDLILNLHLKPTGKPESVRARIGLYFTPKPATAQPMLLQLENDAALDIPPGDKDFVSEDELKLPVAVELLGIYPHAHYLGKRMEAWVTLPTLPTGARHPLLLIKDWDIDRQSVYRLADPLFLPKGSVVHMRYTYDNSASNPRNRHSPPIRVRAGNRSEDEMGHLWLQVLPKPAPSDSTDHTDPRAALERAWMQSRLRKNPHDQIAEYNLASLAMEEHDPRHAADLYRAVLAQSPNDVRALTALGSALELSGDTSAAEAQFRAALAQDPANVAASFDLAQALLGEGSPAAAKAELQQLLTHSPDDFEALSALAQIDQQQGNLSDAEQLLTHALRLHDDPDAERALALVYAGQGDLSHAVDHLEGWKRLAPNDAEAHRALAQVYLQLARIPDALAEQTLVVQLNPNSASDWNDLGVIQVHAGDRAAARRDFERALTLEPGNQAALQNLHRL
jgi:Flp pilus assembly protein TadD/mono/diheme cytochrome c family protein